MNAAFSAAKDGMSETEVREVFGPPDFIVVGNDEFKAYRVAQMKGLGAAGAYFYKVGSFVSALRIPYGAGVDVSRNRQGIRSSMRP